MANDIIGIVVTDNSDNVQINATPNLVSINVTNTSGNIIGSNYFLSSSFSALPTIGDTTTLYVVSDTSFMYRWNGSAYVQIYSTAAVVWGGITGTLSNQTDLQTALNTKQANLSGTGFVKSSAGIISYDTNTYLTSSSAITTYVPYTGASGNVNLGTNNINANNFLNAFSNITASGTQVVLTVSSAPEIVVNGSGGQTIKLPDATTLSNGASFLFNNNQSSGAILVNNNSNTLVVSVPSGGYCEVILIDNSIAAGSWDRHFEAPANVSWSTNTFDYAGSITSATWNGNVVQPNRGGTGQSTYTDGQLLIGNTSGNTLSKSTLSTGTGISITNGNGSISIASTITQYTDTLARAAHSFIAGSGAYNSTTGVISIPTNNNQITNGAGYITLSSLSATSPIVYTNTTGVISIPVATTSINGYLSSTDWTTFNNKANALSGTTNTIPKFTSSTGIGNSNITDSGTTITLGTDALFNGSIGVGSSTIYNNVLRLAKIITGDTVAFGVQQGGVVQSMVTADAYGFRNVASTQATTFTLGNYRHFTAGQGTFGAGSTVTNQYGFICEPLSGATNNYGFFGKIASATNNWNIYMEGTAKNYLNGSLFIGSTTDAGYKLDVTGSTRLNGLTTIQGTTASDTAPLGAEIATTGSGTNWTGTAFSTGYTHTVGSTANLTDLSVAVIGTTYRVAVTITGRTAGSITIVYGGETYTSGRTSSYTTAQQAITTSGLVVTPTSDFDGTVVFSINSVGNSSASLSFSNSSAGVGIELRSVSDTSNTFIGLNVGRKGTIGSSINIQNTFIGAFAGSNNSSGRTNTFVGYNNGSSNSSGNNNVSLGQSAFLNNTKGSDNTSIGVNSLTGNLSGNQNIALGFSAGTYIANGSTNNSTGNNSIFIGISTKALADSQTNQIVIGNTTTGLGSNTTVLGNSSTTLTALYGAVITGGTATDASAQLQADSTTKGFLPPRMTTTQKNAISTPATGLTVFDTTLGKLCVFSTTWQTITSV